ncbi:MAG: hypothetical protein A3E80_04730 [Chlamydiae bacterium RIFCSPHIGHO2_12_FULL_49_9]|nr:MAG: hypothetical protein A3E80_04730 [Chlamydiae bacterium RIFCSPHIGHO2_12_FULL_49_9]HLB52534.1 CPBP family intramembrane glutamic endopeptidase [Chlamydiales bacterium]
MVLPVAPPSFLSTLFSEPLIEPRVAKKVAAVALACLVVFGLNFAGVANALMFGGLTWIDERTLREEKTDWFDGKSVELVPFVKSFLWISLQRVAISVICIAAFVLGGFVLPVGNPQVALEALKMAGFLQFIFRTVIIAPIAEEILFRGFLQERLEDRSILLPFSKETREEICNVAQAILFGFAHITGGQVSEAGKWIVMAITTHMGYAFGKLKLKKKSLVTPMLMHGAFNGVAVALA